MSTIGQNSMHNKKVSVALYSLMKFLIKIFFILALMLSGHGITVIGQQRNDKLLNRPYADLRRWHLGFSVGVHTQDLQFTHNGFITESGESWFMEQPSFSPGFCVNGLIDFRLNNFFNVRFTPGMYFGNRNIEMRDANGGLTESQNIKSNLIVMPVDLKFSAVRYYNARPYLIAGAMATFDISRKKQRELLQLKSTDLYLTIGFGCDFYLPYFKFNPEVKFCFGLCNMIEQDRPDLSEDPDKLKFTQSLTKATSQMVVFTFYFE